jgi:hypothetical protein
MWLYGMVGILRPCRENDAGVAMLFWRRLPGKKEIPMGSRVMTAFLLMASLAAQAPSSLTPADIEKVTGLKGIHVVPATSRGAVPGRDNFADASGRIVLWLQTMSAEGFTRARAQPAKTMSGITVEPKLFHAAVAGLGDEAFDSPDGTPIHALYVKKGAVAFGLIANVSPTNAPLVTLDQLKALARVMLGRM